MIQYEQQVKPFIKGVLNSYAQIFFSDRIFFAIILLVVSFLDVHAGICGLASVLIANTMALCLGFDHRKTYGGFYGFNALLVGLGLGIYFEPGWVFILILVLAAILTFFLTIFFEGVIGKYTLPYLSIPFLMGIWVITLATREFYALGISDRGVYTLNDLYILGGAPLVRIYTWWNELGIPVSIRTYFISLGAIFFQYNVLSGILISAGLLIWSRMALVLSLLGFYAAYLFYGLIGAEITEVTYTYIGFNYILTAIALGGYFLVPSRLTYVWVLILIPIVAILTISLSHVFYTFGLSIYSLPFNLIVLLFLYVLKSRLLPGDSLQPVIHQHHSPEQNLYIHQNYKKRFKAGVSYLPVYLPFWGEWTVSQGYNGSPTHQEDWRHALDFVITDEHGNSYHGTGEQVGDYYCYGKHVLAPADGFVSDIIDGVEDNNIGDVNLDQNWGNTIVVKHSEYLYAKLSHLKAGSFKVAVGEFVRQGQVLATIGNSGRSPEPHLHFQFQATPFVGSATLDYPIANYISLSKGSALFESLKVPEQHATVANIQVNELVRKAYHLIPGQKLKLEIICNGHKQYNEWEVFTTPQNQPYLYCHNTHSYAWFHQDKQLFYFKHFEGDRSSALFHFYLSSFKLQLGYYQDMDIHDHLLVSDLFSKASLLIQDLFAPFFMFAKADYSIRPVATDDDLSPSYVILKSSVTTTLFGSSRKHYNYTITLGDKGLQTIEINKNDQQVGVITCIG